MIAAARKALEAAEAAPIPSAQFVALKAFGYQDRDTRETIPVAHGEVVDAAELRRHGCNLEKLRVNGFVRRLDEQ